jgi:hypothetical protein
LVGIVRFSVITRWKGAFLTVFVLLAVAAMVLINPSSKYLVPLIPIVAIYLSLGLLLPLSLLKRAKRRWLKICLISLFLFSTAVVAFSSMEYTQQRMNARFAEAEHQRLDRSVFTMQIDGGSWTAMVIVLRNSTYDKDAKVSIALEEVMVNGMALKSFDGRYWYPFNPPMRWQDAGTGMHEFSEGKLTDGVYNSRKEHSVIWTVDFAQLINEDLVWFQFDDAIDMEEVTVVYRLRYRDYIVPNTDLYLIAGNGTVLAGHIGEVGY